MTTILHTYLAHCRAQLETIENESGPAIEAAAQAVAAAIMAERNFYLFGSGHSALIAREGWWRAGGLAPAMPINDLMGGDAERVSGVAIAYLAHYDLGPGDVILVISNSGINHVPIEIALESKARGLTVVALTSLAHSRAVDSRHPGGQKLYQLADIVIDTHGIPGDAAIPLQGSPARVGPTSTVVGAAIVQSVMARAAEIMALAGFTPPVLASVNSPEGDAHNRAVTAKYRGRLVRYEVPTVDLPQASRSQA